MDLEKFTRDVNNLVLKLSPENEEFRERINFVKHRLTDLYKKNIVKINHSVMEMICAMHLIRYGYEVDVEKPLSGSLVCDLYAKKGDGDFIVEIETGFTPPEHALDPMGYYRARIASKIARYSKHASKFALATPQQSILTIHAAFMKPVKNRSNEEIISIKDLCDRYYKNPPITTEEIRYGRLHSILVLNIDDAAVIEFDPEIYNEIFREASRRMGL